LKRLLLVPLVSVLTGCPGGQPAPTFRNVFTQGETICFSINKKDALNYYSINSTQGGEYKMLYNGEKLNLSYPNTCIKVKLKNGYRYYIYYGLNEQNYTDNFFIDIDGVR